MGYILAMGYRQVYEEHYNMQDYFYLKIIHLLFKKLFKKLEQELGLS